MWEILIGAAIGATPGLLSEDREGLAIAGAAFGAISALVFWPTELRKPEILGPPPPQGPCPEPTRAFKGEAQRMVERVRRGR